MYIYIYIYVYIYIHTYTYIYFIYIHMYKHVFFSHSSTLAKMNGQSPSLPTRLNGKITRHACFARWAAAVTVRSNRFKDSSKNVL